jgi:serine/threonine protein kinase
MELDRKLLGKGKFGKVFEVENERGERIALKIVHPRNFNLIEIDVLSRMKSPYLIRSMGEIKYFPGEGEGMTMELKENNLSKFNLQQTTPGQIKRIIVSLMLGIECLHKKGFLHLDVKPGNCLYDFVNGNYTGYISDFGHAIRCRDSYQGVTRESRAGSLKYFPYEILEKKDNYLFDDKSDVWSLGVTILVFLGMNYKFEFKFGDTNEYKTQMIKKYWDDEPIENIIRYNVNNLNFLEEDKIDLIEMLIHMTKKDRNERLSSRDFKELRFYKKNILPNECILSSPREILYIPYSSSNVMRGINSLNSYFETKYTGFRLDTYFLCIELFIRMMQVSPLEISDQTLEEIIQYCFVGSLKYYKETKESISDISFSEDSVYKLSKLLNGDIAPNRFFYKAMYLDDLVLLKEILFKNYYLISMYSHLNVEKVFEYFRQNYDYSETKIEEKMRFSDMMKSTVPTKNKDTILRTIEVYFLQGIWKSILNLLKKTSVTLKR